MATKNNITVLKRSSVPGKVPTTAQLAFGELAMNTNDGKLYLKKYDGIGVEEIVDVTNYNPANVAITGGSINGTSVGATTASTGRFTTDTADLFQANVSVPAGSSTVGGIAWNDADGTLEFKLKGGEVTLQIGQENVIRVTNDSGVDLVDGQIVVISGAQGLRPKVVRAIATDPLSSQGTLGVVTEHINNHNQGFITTYGLVNNLDTSAWAEGDTLWIGSATPGQLTNVKPTAPGSNAIRVGTVVNSSSVEGSIFVDTSVPEAIDDLRNVQIDTPINGHFLVYEGGQWVNKASGTTAALTDLNDVVITSPQNDQVLKYNSTSSTWENQTVPAPSSTLNDLTDVTLTTPEMNQILYFDSDTSQWKNTGNANVSSLTVAGVPVFTLQDNVGIGTGVFSSLTTGINNVAIGPHCLENVTSGETNLALGFNVLNHVTTGGDNTAMGDHAMRENITGNYNSAYGAGALLANTTGSMNTALGWWSANTAVNSNNLTAVGAMALFSLETGDGNTAVGFEAQRNLVSGSLNTSLGIQTLWSAVDCSYNTAVGYRSLFNTTTGSFNVGVGSESLYKNLTGESNLAIGTASLWENLSGNRNIAIGNDALNMNTTGSDNIAIGSEAGFAYSANANTIGDGNIFIGANAIGLAPNSSNQIVLGNGAVGRGNNTIVIGSDSTSTTYIYGTVLKGDGTPLGGGSGSVSINGSMSVDFGSFTSPAVDVHMDFGSFV